MGIYNIFFLWNIILIVNSFLITNLYYKGKSLANSILNFFILFYSQVIFVFTILGIFSKITPLFITIFFSIIFLFLIFQCKKLKIKKINLEEINFSSFPVVLFVIVSYLVSMFYQRFLPPLTTDGLYYHLPFALHYFKSKNLSLPVLYFTDVAMTYYPQGGDILYLFTIFSKNEFFLKIVQLPFVFVGAVSVYLLMRENNFSKELSIIGACLFSMIKPVFSESYLCFVDLIMAGYFLASLYYFYSPNNKNIFLGFLSAGLLIGTKNFSLFYFLVLLPFSLSFILPLKGQKKEVGVSTPTSLSTIWFIIFGTIFFLLIGGFSYWRNFIFTGNPFFPAEISLGKFVIFPGIYIYPHSSIFSSLKNIFHLFINPISQTDPFPVIILILFSFLILSLFLSYKEKSLLKYLFFIPFLLIFLYGFFIPFNYHQIRHFLPLYGILIFGFVYPFKKFNKINWIIYLFFLLFLINDMPKFGIPKVFIIFGLSLCLLFFSEKKKRIKECLFFFLVCFLVYLVHWYWPVFTGVYKRDKYTYWKVFYTEQSEIWEFVQKNSGKGKNIAYIGEFFLYPFYGENYQNNVLYQSVNTLETMPIHFYPIKKISFFSAPEELEKIYRGNPSFEIWMEGLRRKKIDWIVIRKERNFIEKEWIDKNKEIFNLIFFNNFAEIYLFNDKRTQLYHH